jgi:hypothetical protein
VPIKERFEPRIILDYLLVRRKRGSNTMSESDTALYDEEVFSDELPDAALEVAGSKCWEGPASSFTITFCSGIDTCPGLRVHE